ncbi:MAG: glycogen synthase [Candidatus Nanopelagicaceae bacterium]|nr:glycogen synthase [Candidatus Nanopelagicaceae bacterium]
MIPINVGLVTKEWPPHLYGGAGVHVVQLAQALRKHPEITLSVHCFGEKRTDALAHEVPREFLPSNPALQAIVTDTAIADSLGNVDVVHTHTWYANLAGHLASLMYGIPHIVTAHSLEPLRPWKADQLAGGYQLSSWIEKTSIEAAAAVIAVSDGMRADILSAYPNVDPEKVHTIRNGVDTTKFAPHLDPHTLAKYNITGRYGLFVGRITRQKGLAHLLRAWRDVPAEYGLVIAAGSPDEPMIGQEVAELIAELQLTRKNIWWIQEMLPHDELTAILTSADLFLCPSIYEPLGIVNLEAMGCTTAVLASDVGGIPEVVEDGVTGELVHFTSQTPLFESNLTQSIVRLMDQPELLRKYGLAGRERAQKLFGWDGVATATIALYRKISLK